MDHLKKGVTASALASEFNIDISTVTDIKKKRTYANISQCSQTRIFRRCYFQKIMKTAKNDNLECAVYTSHAKWVYATK